MYESKVEWYGDEALLVIDEATDEFVTRLAFQGEGLAKADAPVDTGFMRNAIYGLGPAGSHRDEAWPDGEYVSRETGKRAVHRKANEPDLERGTAAIHGAAEYTIYQEERVGFLYRALEQLQRYAGGVIERVGKEYLGD